MAEMTDAHRLEFVRTLLVCAQQVGNSRSLEAEPRRGFVNDMVHAAYLMSLPKEPQDG